MAPARVIIALTEAMISMWRSLHDEVLEELGSLFHPVYSGEKLRNWPSILAVTIMLFYLWERIQYDCRRDDYERGETF